VQRLSVTLSVILLAACATQPEKQPTVSDPVPAPAPASAPRGLSDAQVRALLFAAAIACQRPGGRMDTPEEVACGKRYIEATIEKGIPPSE
jgi:hypothetical protein